MQIQEIKLLPNQDSGQSIINVDVEEPVSSSEEESSTITNNETLISIIDSPVQPIQTVQLLVPPLDPTENMNIVHLSYFI